MLDKSSPYYQRNYIAILSERWRQRGSEGLKFTSIFFLNRQTYTIKNKSSWDDVRHKLISTAEGKIMLL